MFKVFSRLDSIIIKTLKKEINNVGGGQLWQNKKMKKKTKKDPWFAAQTGKSCKKCCWKLF
jgi:hypothetical protein